MMAEVIRMEALRPDKRYTFDDWLKTANMSAMPTAKPTPYRCMCWMAVRSVCRMCLL